MPFFRLMTQTTTFEAGDRGRPSVRRAQAAFVRRRWSRWPGRAGRRNSTRHGAASSNGPKLIGCVIEVTDGPGQGIASACGSTSSSRSSYRVGQVIRGGTDADGSPQRCPGPIPGRESWRSRRRWAACRARRTRARHPQHHPPTTADMALHQVIRRARPRRRSPAQTSSSRSTRTRARRRACAHQGTAQHRVADGQEFAAWGGGERAEDGRGARPLRSAASVVHGRIQALDQRGEPGRATERDQRRRRHGGDDQHQRRPAPVSGVQPADHWQSAAEFKQCAKMWADRIRVTPARIQLQARQPSVLIGCRNDLWATYSNCSSRGTVGLPCQ